MLKSFFGEKLVANDSTTWNSFEKRWVKVMIIHERNLIKFGYQWKPQKKKKKKPSFYNFGYT
jgi:hypothetical protein